MVNVKTRQLTLGGQFDAYKRGQLERNIQINKVDRPNAILQQISLSAFDRTPLKELFANKKNLNVKERISNKLILL
jgi:hypothetical protein